MESSVYARAMATVAITGANRGIGLELCTQLRARGDEVVALCRTASARLRETGARIEEGIDVSDDAVVAALRHRLDGLTLDAVINNAGILTAESLDDLDWDRMRRQFEVNSLGPLRVTSGVLPRLQRGSKILIVTSRMGSVADNTSGSRYGYRMSKAAVNMAGVSLAHDLESRGIAVGIVHPGFVRTEMTGHQGMIDPPEAAAGIIARLDALSLETSGGFWHQSGERLPW
jgi:NAD(P)-dependent dehydrogenase (short-subunit alcohol dehydrogenase family)